MLQMEQIIKQFCWGISVLTAYLHYNNKINYSDINILSEGFVRDLLNTLFDLKLCNPGQQNSPGYDLISKRDKVVVQISATCTPQKVKHTFSTLNRSISEVAHQREVLENDLANVEKSLTSIKDTIEHHQVMLVTIGDKQNNQKREQLSFEIQQLEDRKMQFEFKLRQIRKELAGIEDIRGYSVQFFFLCKNADTVKNYKNKCGFIEDVPKELRFYQSEDVFCFTSLIRKVQSLSQITDQNKIKRLLKFMSQNANIFAIREPFSQPKNKVSKIINEYADNFTSPLFLHKYSQNTRVTLENLFVEPNFSRINMTTGSDNFCNNIVALLDSFIWDSKKDRLLFIDGDAAIGKTSLISWLCYHYREFDDIGKSVFFNMQLVCVRLRDLSLTKNFSAEDCILKYLSFEDIDSFEEQYNNALIVLEGADELGIVNGIDTSAIEQFILNVRHVFSSHKIVITSRPKFINMNLFSGSTQTFSYQHYILNHFSAEKRAVWLSNYEAKDKCGQTIPQNTKEYLNELNDEEATGVADTPLALYLLATCDMTEPIRNNKWALYYKIFYEVIRKTPYNEAFHGKGSPLMHKALQEESFAETVYFIIGEIANRMFTNFKEERFYISSKELDDIIATMYSSNNLERRNAVRKCCVLCAYWKENSDIGALEFYHNDIRAFFMSEYIYRKFSCVNLSSSSQESIHHFIELACETFQYGIISRTTWAQTFSFLYWRLQYEKDNHSLNAYLPNEQEVENTFTSILYETVNNSVMWKYSFQGTSYESIKTTFFNFTLFLRIWFSPVAPIPLTSFSNKDYRSFWHNNELFKDWIKLFSDTIEISKNKHIAFGSQMKYHNMIFDSANLIEACFETSVFVQSTFRGADLKKAIFCNSHLEDVDFSDADLSDANFDGATIVNANFSSANLCRTNFQNAKIINSIWPRKATNFYDTVFTNASIVDTDWKSLNFKNVLLTSTKFKACSFRNVQFPELLEQVNFINCSIAKCSFNSCSGLHFCGEESIISDSRFSNMVSCCSFENVNLSDSNWTNATLDEVLFINSKINGLSFRAAKINKLAFQNCSIDGNIDIFQASLFQSTLNLLKKQTTRIINVSSAKIIVNKG